MNLKGDNIYLQNTLKTMKLDSSTVEFTQIVYKSDISYNCGTSPYCLYWVIAYTKTYRIKFENYVYLLLLSMAFLYQSALVWTNTR
jgi:hypothetical protein